MAGDDVVSGLLAKLEAVEQEANEGHSLGCSSTDPCYEPPYEDGPDYGRCDCRQQLTLRLCRAHRDLIDEYRKRQQMSDQLGFDEGSKDSDAHLLAQGIEAGLRAAVHLVARGLGVEDKEN